MRRTPLRARRLALVTVASLMTASGVVFLPIQAGAVPPAGAVISNGTVQLGVNALGDLNYDCNVDVEACPGASAGDGTTTVGLRYEPDNLESTAGGSPYEGWGVADGSRGGITGSANQQNGSTNVTAVSFSSPTPDRAISTVRVANPDESDQSLQVVQDYHPSAATDNLFANTVTITNTGQRAIGDLLYRRTVDWDIEPSATSEWVTAGGGSPQLAFNSDDGFASSDPLAGPSYGNSPIVCGSDPNYTGACTYQDLGNGGEHAGNPDATPTDSGALYDFSFGELAKGQSFTFTLFYGAAPTENDALAALSAAGAQVYSLGESSCTANETTVDGCASTNPGGGGGDAARRLDARPAADDPPANEAPAADPPADGTLAGVDLGEPATFMLGFATTSSDVSVSQTDDPDPVVSGANLTYDLTVANTGSDEATGVHVEDALPPGVTLVSATPDQGTCSGTTTVTCELGALAADDTAQIAIVVTTGAMGTLSNTTTVTSATPDTDPDNNTSTERTVVNPVPPPVANGDSYDATEDTALTVSSADGVLNNDTNPSGVGSLTVAPGTTAPSHGTVTLNSDGSFTYQPTANYHGTDSFTYRATNGSQTSTAATVTITIAAANDPPVVSGDSYDTDEDTTLTVAAPGVLANDTDADGDPLTAVLGTGPSHGQLTLGSDGRVSYVPAANYHGPDSFTYRASDGQSQSGLATVSITVASVADPIVARDDAYTTPRDTPLTVDAPGVLGNDTDVDGRASASTLTQPAHGTLTLNEDGSFVYTPTADYVGQDSFRYTAGDQSAATVTITVTRGTNRTPVAHDDGYIAYEDIPYAVTSASDGILDNDTDPDGDTVIVSQHTNPSHGDLVLNSDGTFTYTPDENYNGEDSFTYAASDGTLTSGPATVTITVEPVQDRPVANPDHYTTPRDTQLTVGAPGVLGNDTDVDGDSLFVDDVTDPAHGTVHVGVGNQGGFTYTPNPGFVGIDTFTYRARSGEETSEPVTVTIVVTAVNHAPVAESDTFSTLRDTTLTVATPGVLTNDSDPDGNAISAVRTSGPSHGTLALSANGRVVYTPDTGFTGTDRFRYRATDGASSSPSVTVTITVTAPVTPPTSTPPSTTPPTTPPAPPTSDVPVPPVSNPPTDTPPVDEPTEPPPPPSTPVTPPSGSSGTQSLRLTALSVNPGGDLRAKGSGCAPNDAIQLTVAGRPAGTGTADSSGGFDIPVTTTGLDIGTHTVTAICSGKQLVAQVALVSTTSNTNAPTAQALVVAAALAFFLLLLGLILRRPTT